MRILITRPREDAAAFAERLGACGVESLVVPLMEIVFEAGLDLDLRDVRAILLTSANGARALDQLCPTRDLPVFAVGPATAQAARDAGFRDIAVSGGDVVHLAETVRATLPAGPGVLLHVSGSVVAGDLAGRLGRAGYTVRRATAYSARPMTILPQAVRDALTGGAIEGVAFFSPRSAALFHGLIEAAGLGGTLGRLTGYCLSDAVARDLPAPPWGATAVAARPDGEALAELICADAGRS